MIAKPLPKIEIPGKPTYLKLTEDFDFFQLFRSIEQKYDNCFILESLGEESYVSRHHIIGFDPVQSIFDNYYKTFFIEDN